MHRVLIFSALAAQLITPASSSPVQYSLSDKDSRNHQKEQYNLEPDANYAFSGITTFHQLSIANCLSADYYSAGTVDDILVVGLPFDTATSYRSGTRFGPNAIRQGSRANSLAGHYNYRQRINPFEQGISIVDCGDFPISPFDNGLAFAQMETWYRRILEQNVKAPKMGVKSQKSGRVHPTLVALGGDHSISLPILRALYDFHGPVAAIHIDAHIDTWSPDVFAGAKGAGSKQAQFSDGTPYYWAGKEGLLTNHSIHAGIRSTLDSAADIDTDRDSGFTIIPASDMLTIGVEGVIHRIWETVPRSDPVYVSLDVDSLDPAFAPGTAGPASGGWTPREVIQIIIDGLRGYNIVGIDVVEVLPGMDSAEITGIAAAEFVFELITTLVKNKKETGVIV